MPPVLLCWPMMTEMGVGGVALWYAISSGGNYVEKQCFVAKNLFYQTVLLRSLYLL